MTPKKINECLDKFVQGQTDAKKALSIIGFIHQTAYLQSLILDAAPSAKMAKTNILLLGPSGCGKTYMVQKLAETLQLPFYQISAATISNEGYVGTSLNDHLINYFEQGSNTDDPHKKNFGIIFIDEIDKLSATGSSTRGLDGWLAHAQTSLLRACEGFEVFKGKSSSGGEGTHAVGKTHDLLFIFAGNFAEVRRKRKERKIANIGFTREEPKEQDDIVKELVDVGMLAELVGRMGFITELNQLSADDLREIIVTKESSIVKQYASLFKFLQYDLTLDDTDIDSLIKKCQDSDIGARILKKEVLQLLMDEIYNIGETENVDGGELSETSKTR